MSRDNIRILLIGIGEYYHIGAFFRKALQELGYEHDFLDEGKYQQGISLSLINRIYYRILKRPFWYRQFNRDILISAKRFNPQMVIVTKGAFISPATLEALKQRKMTVLINYATDDPFNPSYMATDLVRGIPFYDIYACTKTAIMEDVRQAGCQNVIFVPFGYQPDLHYPEKPATQKEKKIFVSDVVFVGNADKERNQIMLELANSLGTRMHLYGGYWNRDIRLRRYTHGFALGRNYRLALGGTKIALGLLRHANRDKQTMRTFEIPACGAFMLAERTDEHLDFFTEGKEIACFNSTEELIEKIHYYLNHDTEREHITQAGYQRVINGHNTYKDRLITIINVLK